jgi:hypothetical protein
MSYRRQVLPHASLEGETLTAAMVGIGMQLAAIGASNPNIEDTLFYAAREALDGDDLRVFSVLVTWLSVHGHWVNVDRMTRLARTERSPRVRVFWSGVGHWLGKDRRFAKLAALHDGPRIDLLPTGTSFQVSRFGEDPRLEGGPLRVPANAVRTRETDVLRPTELAVRHRAYRFRLMIGPSYRADMWAALDAAPRLTAAELARRTYGSFATAWQVKRDFALVHPDRAQGQAA